VKSFYGGLQGGDGGGFGCRGWLIFILWDAVLWDALVGGRRVVLHNAFDEVADDAFSFCSLADFGAWSEGA
jgi:hypothetical protein